MAENNENNIQQDVSEVARIRREKLEALRGANDPFALTRFDRDSSSREIRENFEALEGGEKTIAGRILSKRVMGKASFFHIADGAGSIQCYARRDLMGDEPYAAY